MNIATIKSSGILLWPIDEIERGKPILQLELHPNVYAAMAAHPNNHRPLTYDIPDWDETPFPVQYWWISTNENTDRIELIDRYGGLYFPSTTTNKQFLGIVFSGFHTGMCNISLCKIIIPPEIARHIHHHPLYHSIMIFAGD